MVAIVGRPNVGKSSLLNCLTRQRISIVEPTAGVTRDRVSGVVEYEDHYFELIDTGGYGIDDHDNLTEYVEGQIQYAISGASLILFVVDLLTEMTPLDAEVARLLRGTQTPVLLVANKADTPAHEIQAGGAISLGFGEPICVSALHGHNRRGLLDRIVEMLGDLSLEEPTAPVMKIALVGRRNVGKSTFINALAGADRVIVSEVPGTTRDSVDVRFEMAGREFLAIDTAGLKRRSKHKNSIEYFSSHRALASIRRADVILFLIDATAPITEVDKKLAEYVINEYKPCLMVVNKWDLAKGQANAEDYADYLAKTMPHLAYAPIAFTTATQARNIQSTIDAAQGLFNQARARVTTGELNRAIDDALGARQPSSDKHGAQPKIYYATQVSILPPTIVLFVNNPALMRDQYRRFVEKRLRETLPFPETPVRLIWRGKPQRDATGAAGRRQPMETSDDSSDDEF
ncbi:MAG TPA: ribosome biogenesis GTPase Der [Phycisphaerae bacterium]|nr:ribosome biogenesis GTPase Der [Phycisphaerae bacterium]HRW53975.1 ribosome biogenesis GTPase Der [Phycisphaerae bacterium]